MINNILFAGQVHSFLHVALIVRDPLLVGMCSSECGDELVQSDYSESQLESAHKYVLHDRSRSGPNCFSFPLPFPHHYQQYLARLLGDRYTYDRRSSCVVGLLRATTNRKCALPRSAG